jgi:predicted amidophosphoribosyltransferase
MAQCKYCGSETELTDNGGPVCIECIEALEKHDRKPQALKSDPPPED